MPVSPHPAPLAVVTGASDGIGRAIALALLAHGWQVCGWDQHDATIDQPGFSARRVDLADRRAVRDTLAAMAAPQAWVHAAGLLRAHPLGALDADDGERMWRVHVEAATVLANAWLPAMAARGHGRAVLIGSRVAQGLAGRSQYAASKAALVALARSWAAEVVGRGVTVNLVSPAATRTRLLQDPARAGSAVRVPPIGRLIEPREIAALVAFLLGADAAAITGQDIAVCGGASLPH